MADEARLAALRERGSRLAVLTLCLFFCAAILAVALVATAVKRAFDWLSPLSATGSGLPTC